MPTQAQAPTAPGEKSSEETDKILLWLVDPNGRPVTGAKVASFVRIREVAVLGSKLEWGSAGLADEDGQVVLETKDLFRGGRDTTTVYILHEGRRIGAVHEIVRGAPEVPGPIILNPVCRTHGTVKSTGLAALGMPLQWANIYVNLNRHTILNCMFHEQGFDFEFLLPTGEYRLLAYGSGSQGQEPAPVAADTKHQTLSIQVPDGLPELDLGEIELPPTTLSMLTGQPAPELGPIKAWRNGAPVSLRALRGQVVLLYFDGDLPNTSRDLPQLVKLHEALGDKGLTIIALYNCESLEELDRKWVEVHGRFGGVTEVPFRIAIDGGVPTYYEGTDRPRAGATYGRYDITGDPTTVLIDAAGNIVGQPNFFRLREIIAPMLGAGRDESLPVWRRRFNEVYRLADGQVLKRIAPPFIPERMDYYRTEDSHQAGLIPRGPDQMTFHWDGQLQRWGMGFGRFAELGRILSSVLRLKSYEYDGPKSLLDLPLPGDWIVRDEAPPEVKLRALEELVARELGRKIRFEKRSVEREVLVATGKFVFRPPVGTYENKSIHLYATEADPDEGAGGGTAQSMSEFLQMLGDRVNLPVLDRTEPSGPVRIPYRHHRSSRVGRIPDAQEKQKELKVLLDHITAQTELQFEVRAQPVEVWFVTEPTGS